METRNIFKVYLSFTSELEEDKKQLKALVEDLSRVVKKAKNTEIQFVDWRDIAPTAVHYEPQEAINSEIVRHPPNIAICLFWKRFGTPTEGYGSGMEEEVYLFLQMLEQKKIDDLWLIFKTTGVASLNELDATQFMKLMEFKKKLHERRRPAILSQEYNLFEEFSSTIETWLIDAVEKSLNNTYLGIWRSD